MRTFKNNYKELEKNWRGRLREKGVIISRRNIENVYGDIRRPRTLPELLLERTVSFSLDAKPKLTKLLVNVTIQGSLGAVQVVMSAENTVNDLIIASVRQYSKEGRRPILKSTDTSLFDLHYSQFSLERLEREEKLMALGSRHFFLCTGRASSKDRKNQTASCAKSAEKVTKNAMPWVKIMELLFLGKQTMLLFCCKL